LVSRPRYYGGHQWFFVCPVTGGLATVLWRPPGASKFCSRQAWGRQVATHCSLWVETVALITGNQRSSLSSVRLATSIPMTGGFRQSQNGCDGRRTIATKRGSMLAKRSWMGVSKILGESIVAFKLGNTLRFGCVA
jgi:hypothetical protein